MTFYRHYQPLIVDYFRPKAQDGSQPTTAADQETDHKTMKRLRQENTELRKLVNIYAEEIRQLMLRAAQLEESLEPRQASRRSGRAASRPPRRVGGAGRREGLRARRPCAATGVPYRLARCDPDSRRRAREAAADDEDEEDRILIAQVYEGGWTWRESGPSEPEPEN